MKKLLILSGKGGTGKTTTAAAFIHFAKAQVFADCDVDAPNLHLVTQMETQPQRSAYYGSQKAVVDSGRCVGCGTCVDHCRFGAMSVVDGKAQVNAFACEGCGVCVALCPPSAVQLVDDVAGALTLYTGQTVFSTAELVMGRGNSGKLVTQVKTAMVKAAPPEMELAIIDGSPGIGCPVIASVSGVDWVLVVTEPTVSGLSDLTRLLKTTAILNTRVAVCVNKWDVSPEQTDAIQALCHRENIPFVGRIPYDKTASTAINQGQTLAAVDGPGSQGLYQVYQATMALMNEERGERR